MKDGVLEETVVDKERYYRFLILSCVGLYMAMMMIKNVYVAEIATIIRVFSTTKSQASMVNTYYFITYALTQFILAFLMVRLNVKRYLLITVPISVATYLSLVLFIKEIGQMFWLFLINGFAQAGVVACTKLTLGKYLPSAHTARANSLYSLSSGLGFALSYGCCAICVEYFSWKIPFYFFSAVFLIMLALYVTSTKLAEKNCPVVVAQEGGFDKGGREREGLIKLKGGRASVGFIVLWMWIAFLTCTVSYGINNWVVSYLHEVFGFPESLSMVVTIIVQVMAMLGPVTAIAIGKRLENYIALMRNLYILPFIISALMLFVLRVNIVLSICLLIVFEFFISAGGACSSIMAFDMRKQINIGSVSAFTNTASSLAAGFIPTVVGVIVDSFSWTAQYVFIGSALTVLLLTLSIFNFYVKKDRHTDKTIKIEVIE